MTPIDQQSAQLPLYVCGARGVWRSAALRVLEPTQKYIQCAGQRWLGMLMGRALPGQSTGVCQQGSKTSPGSSQTRRGQSQRASPAHRLEPCLQTTLQLQRGCSLASSPCVPHSYGGSTARQRPLGERSPLPPAPAAGLRAFRRHRANTPSHVAPSALTRWGGSQDIRQCAVCGQLHDEVEVVPASNHLRPARGKRVV